MEQAQGKAEHGQAHRLIYTAKEEVILLNLNFKKIKKTVKMINVHVRYSQVEIDYNKLLNCHVVVIAQPLVIVKRE